MMKWSITLLLVSTTFAQQWSGILAPQRAIDWSATSPGVVGGIPSASWTQQGSTVAAYTGTAATINNALAACGTNHFVQLAAGTFALSTGITIPSNCELRGQGASQTFIVYSGNVACAGWTAHTCFGAGNYYGSVSVAPGGTESAAWTAGYAQGATSLTIGTVGSTGILNGQYIYLDQINDTTLSGSGLVICDTVSANCRVAEESSAQARCSVGQGGSACSGTDRDQVQLVKVVSGCSSPCTGAGPFTITITPGLYAANWRSGQTPGAWWSSSKVQNAGIANLSIDNGGDSGTNFGIAFTNAFNCWVSGVRSLNGVRNHVWFGTAAHITVQNSYFYGTQNASTQSYGVESYIASDNLVLNNIFQKVTTPIMMGSSQGSVFAYNFSIDDETSAATSFMFHAIYGGHDSGVIYNLYEGNIMAGFVGDVFHGTPGGLATMFRNRFIGWEWNVNQNAPKSTATVPIQPRAYNRFENVIGNVLGCNNTSQSVYPGNCGAPYHTTYQTSNGGASASAVIYDFGAGLNEGSNTVPNDSYALTSTMRWGNYDVVNAAVQWANAEVPTGLSDGYANTVPGSHILPASFVYPTQPAWWPSAKPWPPIGPDVTGGNLTGVAGLAYTTPAADCYLTTMGGSPIGAGSALTFNPSACYSISSGPIASFSPTSLTFSSTNAYVTSAGQNVTLANTGTAVLVITSIALSGTNSGDYAISANTCPVGSNLGIGSSCTVTITFTPLALGTRTASVLFTDNASGSPQSVSLSGTGTDPVTYRPSSFIDTGTVATTNPTLAYDNNLLTFATGSSFNNGGSDLGAYLIAYTGFKAIVNPTPPRVALYVANDWTTSTSVGGAGVQYSLNNGSTWTILANGLNHGPATDVVALPINQDLTQLQVRFISNGCSAAPCTQIGHFTEIWVNTQAIQSIFSGNGQFSGSGTVH